MPNYLGGSDSIHYSNWWLTLSQEWVRGPEHATKKFYWDKSKLSKRRRDRMGSRLDLIQIVHGRWLESAALLGFPYPETLGKRIGLTLANSLMCYLSLIKQEK